MIDQYNNLILKTFDLSLKSQEKTILKDINLAIEKNTLNIIIGPNGAGKSSLLNSIMGILPENFEILGKITFKNQEISNLSISQKAKFGIFLSFQSPVEIPGLKLLELLKRSVKNIYGENTTKNLIQDVQKYIKNFNLPAEMLNWEVNNNLSGGQKKLSEALQMLVLKPKLILIDEIDSGLDFDKIKIISKIINYLKDQGATILLVSHHHAISEQLKIDQYILMKNGRVEKTGGQELLNRAIEIGYE